MLFYHGNGRESISQCGLGDLYYCRSCIIDENVQIGSGSIIGENARIGNSIIGHNCNIGDNVVLENAYVWDNVTISANSSVSWSILANNVTLLENTTINQGCLLSVGVTIGPDETIPKYSRLSLHSQPKSSIFADDSDEEEEDTGKFSLSSMQHGKTE